MTELRDWSITASANTGNAADGYFKEGMAYSDVNNAAREMQAIIARDRKDRNGTIVSVGSTSSYVLAVSASLAGFRDGDAFVFQAHAKNIGATTLQVSTLSAKPVLTTSLADLANNHIVAGGVYQVYYQSASGNFKITNPSLLSGDNTWLGAQTFTGTIAYTSTDAGAAAAPAMSFIRDSASPAANDSIGRIVFIGNDSGAAQQTYGAIAATISDPTAGSEDGLITILTTVAGASVATAIFGQGLAMVGASGGDQGSGTINAKAVYDDGAGPLTDYVFDAAVDGQINVSKWDAKVPDVNLPDGSIEIRTHEPARRFSARLDDLDPKAYGQKWRASRRLPAFDDKAGEKLSVGEYAQRLLETCEVQAIHIDKLLERIEALEAKSGRPN